MGLAVLLSGRGRLEDSEKALAELRTEVEDAYSSFKMMVASEPRHSRIDDVDKSFRQLLQNIRAAALSRSQPLS